MRRLALIALALAFASPAFADSLEAQRARLAALNAQEDQLAARIGAERNTVSHLLASLALFSRDPPPPLIVRAEDARDAVRAEILAKALAGQLQTRLRELKAEAEVLAHVRRQAAVASGDLFVAESEIEDRRGRLDAVARDAALLAPPEARDAVAQADALAPPTRIHAPAAGRLAVRYGGRLESGLTAQGVAYRTAPGAGVVAPAAGVVAYAGPVNGWGDVVILRAGGGCHMVLSGLGKVSVTAGQSVAAAYPIGAMPTLGQSSPELYFEVRLARGPVDPSRLINGG